MQNRVRLGFMAAMIGAMYRDESTAVTGLWWEDELPCKHERGAIVNIGKIQDSLKRVVFKTATRSPHKKKVVF